MPDEALVAAASPASTVPVTASEQFALAVAHRNGKGRVLSTGTQEEMRVALREVLAERELALTEAQLDRHRAAEAWDHREDAVSQRQERRRATLSEPKQQGPPRPKGAAGHLGIGLAELIEAGWLRAGEVMTATRGNERWHATINGDGTIDIGGVEVRSVTKAAMLVLQRPQDGWRFWKVERDGKLVKLADVKKQMLLQAE